VIHIIRTRATRQQIDDMLQVLKTYIKLSFESLINIRPRQNNRSLEIVDPALRKQVAQVMQTLLGGV
jgi:hypothetical protein